MRPRNFAFLLLLLAAVASCSPNNVSKIPHIVLLGVWPDTGIVKANVDTVKMQFSFIDGDGDIGNDPSSQIWLKDSRFDSTGFMQIALPVIDPTIEDPKKGLEGVCTFYPVPQPVPRTDSSHPVTDTFSYEIYITDRAHHASNHVTTRRFVIKL